MKWPELEKQFCEIEAKGLELRVDVQWGDSGEYWKLKGALSAPSAKRFETLAEVAGTKLRTIVPESELPQSPNRRSLHPQELWYLALWKIGGIFEQEPMVLDQNEAGETLGHIYLGTIHQVVSSSADLCLKLMARIGDPTQGPSYVPLPRSTQPLSSMRLKDISSAKMRKITAFVSYGREDQKVARKLYQDLKTAGIDPWIDTESILPGQEWKRAINAAIRESNFFLALLSSRTGLKRGYVQKELKEGMDVLGELPECDIYLIPIRLDECQLPYEKLRELQWVDMFPSWELGFSRILRSMGIHRENFNVEESISADTDRPPALPMSRAEELIRNHANSRRLKVAQVTPAPDSPFSTMSYRARRSDEKGVIYCHATGKCREHTYYVRKGIGWFYEDVLGGASSEIGLPVSNEEVTDSTGYPISYFEGGYIEWCPETGVARAVAQAPHGERTLAEQKL